MDMTENRRSVRRGIPSVISRSLEYLAALLFFLMLVAPFEFNFVKIGAISALVIASLIMILVSKKIHVAKPFLLWYLIFIGFGVFFSLWAFLIRSNRIDFILRSMPVNIIWPFLYLLMTAHINSYRAIILMHKTMIFGSLIISLYLIFAALSYLGILPISPNAFSLAKVVVGKYEASVQLFLPSTTSLLFLLPFTISYTLLQIYKVEKTNFIYLVFTIVLSVAAVVITARRALILNLLLSPILIYIFLSLSQIKLSSATKNNLRVIFMYSAIFSTIGCIILIKYEILNLDPLIELFINGFDFSEKSLDEGSSVRAEQSSGLIRSWIDYPILGSGLGSSSEYIVRSEVTPWIYELSYLALLYQTGIVGLILYFSLLIWIPFKGITLIRSNENLIFLIPYLVGYTCFLIGNASNPYVSAFDHMWTIFLPLGVMNFCFYNKKAKLIK